MSIQSKPIQTSSEILNFYLEQLSSFGDSAQGVGWKNDEAQNIRFAQLMKVIDRKEEFFINDLGCGTGKFYSFLTKEGYNPAHYHGYDILEEMIASAKQSLPASNRTSLTKIQSEAEIGNSEYTVASGIFNVKYQANDLDWTQHVISTLKIMNEKSSKGIAFNLLTKYSDREFMKSYLYYADPLYIFDFCKTNFSKHVALLHDYGQYDFTIIVRKF